MLNSVKEYLKLESELLESRVDLEASYKEGMISKDKYEELINLHNKVVEDLATAEAFIKAIRVKYSELTQSTLDNETLLLMVSCVCEGMNAI